MSRYILDPTSGVLRIGESLVALTPSESTVLSCLLQRRCGSEPDAPVSKAELTTALYPPGTPPRRSNGVEVFIRRLRQKLDPEGRLKPIRTRRGVGYLFVVEDPDTVNAILPRLNERCAELLKKIRRERSR